VPGADDPAANDPSKRVGGPGGFGGMNQ